MDAESAYLFRHAVVRDAAYELQLPQNRGELHAIAAELIETVFSDQGPGRVEPVAAEIADHWASYREQTGSGRFQEAEIRACQLAAAHAGRSYRLAEKLKYGLRLVEITEGKERAWALIDAAATARQAWQLARAEELLDQCREITAKLGDAELHAYLIEGLGALEHDKGKFDAAERLYQEALDARPKDLPVATAWMRNLGTLYEHQGRMDEAESWFQRSLKHSREQGELQSEGYALSSLAALCTAMGQRERAEEFTEQALKIAHDTGFRILEAQLTGNRAIRLDQAGQNDEAERHYLRAISMHRQTGRRASEGVMLGNLGLLYQSTGRSEEAERLYKQAFEIHLESGNRRMIGITTGLMACLHEETGDLALAESEFQDEIRIHREMGARRAEGIALGNLASLYTGMGRATEALPLFREALEIHAEARNHRFHGIHQCDYAAALACTGDREAAVKLWGQGDSELRHHGFDKDLENRRQAMVETCERAGVVRIDR